MVGYTINPIVTLGAAAIGAVSAICHTLLKKIGINSALNTALSVAVAHVVGSVLIKTFGLAAFYSLPIWALMLWRLLNYVIVGAVEAALLIVLMRNKEILRLLSEIKPKKKEGAKGNDIQ